MRLLLTVVLFVNLYLIGITLGEVEFECPQLFTNLSGLAYTELTPGPLTIVFRETNSISGSPFRLSIHRNNGQDECVILDHIPSQRDNDRYYLTVNIPSIQCNWLTNQCVLRIWQIDTSSGYCTFDTCPLYNSTTPISIRRNPGAVSVCPNRRAHFNMYNWPYDPTRLYKATLTGLSSTAMATGEFVLVGQTLLFKITMDISFSSPTRAERIRFLYYPTVETPSILDTIDVDFTNTIINGSWSDISTFAAFLFRSGELFVDITTSDNSNGEIFGRISLNGINPVDNLYGLEYGSYTDGWLTGDAFVGSSANASFFTNPYGSCILSSTRYFGCGLSNSDGVSTNGGGTVGLAITGNRVWFSMDMFNLTSGIRSVKLQGEASGSTELISFWKDGNRLKGVVDIDDVLQQRIFKGLSSVIISTSRNRDGELSCGLEEGMISFLDSSLEVPAIVSPTNGSATAFFYFSVNGRLNVHITLNSLSSPLEKAHLHGPAYQGIATTNIPFNMMDLISGDMEGGWNVQGSWRNITADELRYFIEGLYYLNMHTTNNPSGELRGQLSIIGEWVCPTSDTLVNQCYWPRLELVEGVESDEESTPYAVGGVIIDRLERFQYSFAFWYIPSDVILTLYVMSPGGSLSTVIIDADDESDIRDNVREISVIFPTDYDQNIDAIELSYAETGRVEFNVTTSSYPRGYLFGELPPITRNRCPGMNFVIAIGGEQGWTPNQDYLPMRLLQDDMLNFTFSSPDNVYMWENENRFGGCVYSAGTQLATAENENLTTYLYSFSRSGDVYFGSDDACENNPPMKIAIYVVGSVSEQIDGDTCTRSLYAYTEEQRFIASASPGAIIAAIFGIVIGIAIIVTVVVIAVIIIVKSQMGGGGGSGEVAKA